MTMQEVPSRVYHTRRLKYVCAFVMVQDLAGILVTVLYDADQLVYALVHPAIMYLVWKLWNLLQEEGLEKHREKVETLAELQNLVQAIDDQQDQEKLQELQELQKELQNEMREHKRCKVAVNMITAGLTLSLFVVDIILLTTYTVSDDVVNGVWMGFKAMHISMDAMLMFFVYCIWRDSA
jgi:hypothetical protein